MSVVRPLIDVNLGLNYSIVLWETNGMLFKKKLNIFEKIDFQIAFFVFFFSNADFLEGEARIKKLPRYRYYAIYLRKNYEFKNTFRI